MNQQRQGRGLIGFTLLFAGLIIGYSLFFPAPVTVLQVTVSQDSSEGESSPDVSGESAEFSEGTVDTASRIGDGGIDGKGNAEPEASVGEHEKININTAGFFELTDLQGIGDATADAILAYRDENGPFESIEGLLAIKGIGEKKLADLAPYITAE